MKEYYYFLEIRKIEEKVSPFLVNLKFVKDNADRIHDMNTRFEKASQDFLRLSTKETLFTSRYLSVDDELKNKEKLLRENSRSKINIIKSIARNLKDLDTIWMIMADLTEVMHYIYDMQIEGMEVDKLDTNSSNWLNELSNVIINGLGEVRECKIVIDFINTNLSILKFITPLIKALRSQKLRQRH